MTLLKLAIYGPGWVVDRNRYLALAAAAAFGAAASVKRTRKTSSVIAKRRRRLSIAEGLLSKMTFTYWPELCFLSATRLKLRLSIFCTVSTLPPTEVISAEILSIVSFRPSSLPAVSSMNKPSYRFTWLLFWFRGLHRWPH